MPPEGLTFAEIAARTGADRANASGRRRRGCLAFALRDELRRGRLRREGEHYLIVPGAFTPELLAALRALTPTPTPAREHNRAPVRREVPCPRRGEAYLPSCVRPLSAKAAALKMRSVRDPG